MEIIFWKLIESGLRVGGYTSRPLGAVLILAGIISGGFWLGGTPGDILMCGAIIVGGVFLGLYIFHNHETRMLVTAFYISTGLLAFCASSWLAYGFYYGYYALKQHNPVTEWLLASDDATIKALVPGDMFQDWETKKQTADDLTGQLQKLSALQLGVGDNPPSSSVDPTSLRLKAQKAGNDSNASQYRIEQYIDLDVLAKGKLTARGIPNEAPPHDNEPIIIKPAQWQYLRISISSGDATDSKGATVFKGVEIEKPKGQK
jgi:hypothetical protein